MNKTVAQPKTPIAKGGSDQPEFELTAYQRNLFLSTAFSMSWQLAIVVLAPIFGGYKLDEYAQSSPVWTIVGFVIAVIGAGAVVWRQAKLLSPPPAKEKRR